MGLEFLGGEQFRAAITQQLHDLDKVIVLWTQHSISSAFVIDEASRARETGKLVPISISNTKPPLGFGDLHTIPFRKEEIFLKEVNYALEGKPFLTGTRSTKLLKNKKQILFFMATIIGVSVFSLITYEAISVKTLEKLPIDSKAKPYNVDCHARKASPAYTIKIEDIFCFSKEAAEADYNLNMRYSNLWGKLPVNDATELMKEERLWMNQRDQKCLRDDAELRDLNGKIISLLIDREVQCVKSEFEIREADLIRKAELYSTRRDARLAPETPLPKPSGL